MLRFPRISLSVRGDRRLKQKIGAVPKELMGTATVRYIENLLLERTQDRFKTKTDPDGAPWAPWAPSTPKRRAKKLESGEVTPSAFGIAHGGILVLSGSLAESIEIKRTQADRGFAVGTGGGFRIGSSHPLARIHQQGTRHIPARPFLGVGTADSILVERHLQRAARRAGLR